MKDGPIERDVTFTEDDVKSWCDRNDDLNPLHLDERAASNGPFSERVVPGLMILDSISGMLSEMGEEGETVILAGVSATRFREPVLLGEAVSFTVQRVEDDLNFETADFEARVPERNVLAASGTVTLAVE